MCIQEMDPFETHLTILSSTEAFLWERKWTFSTGVDTIDLTADVRNSSGPISIKPAIQFAAYRTDRPDAGAAISAGSRITGDGSTHYVETLSGGSKYWFRRGIGFKLSSGSFGFAEVVLHGAHKTCGRPLAPRELEFNPVNGTAAVSYFSLGRPIPTAGITAMKYAILGLANLNGTLQHRMAARVFNDPYARGAWVDLESGWNTPSSGDFGSNSGEISVAGLSMSSNHWLEPGFAVRKDLDASANSRALLRVLGAVKY